MQWGHVTFGISSHALVKHSLQHPRARQGRFRFDYSGLYIVRPEASKRNIASFPANAAFSRVSSNPETRILPLDRTCHCQEAESCSVTSTSRSFLLGFSTMLGPVLRSRRSSFRRWLPGLVKIAQHLFPFGCTSLVPFKGRGPCARFLLVKRSLPFSFLRH